MGDVLAPLIFMILYVALMRWILPRLGVPT
jgi:hypothetical protein